jgi:hypothetical protein
MIVLAVAVVVLLAWAWWDGGREPVRDIAVPLPLPEATR